MTRRNRGKLRKRERNQMRISKFVCASIGRCQVGEIYMHATNKLLSVQGRSNKTRGLRVSFCSPYDNESDQQQKVLSSPIKQLFSLRLKSDPALPFNQWMGFILCRLTLHIHFLSVGSPKIPHADVTAFNSNFNFKMKLEVMIKLAR